MLWVPQYSGWGKKKSLRGKKTNSMAIAKRFALQAKTVIFKQMFWLNSHLSNFFRNLYFFSIQTFHWFAEVEKNTWILIIPWGHFPFLFNFSIQNEEIITGSYFYVRHTNRRKHIQYFELPFFHGKDFNYLHLRKFIYFS